MKRKKQYKLTKQQYKTFKGQILSGDIEGFRKGLFKVAKRKLRKWYIVANEENLRPGEYKFTQEEHKKGGIASGKARREKATMRKTLEMLLEEKNTKGVTYKELATLGLIKGAVKGNAMNYKTIVELLGELQVENNNEPIIVRVDTTDKSELNDKLRVRFESRCKDELNKDE